MGLLQNNSLKKSCTKPGTFSGPKRLKKGSGFLFLHYFFAQVAIAFLFCNSLFVLRFSIYYFTIGGFSPLGKLFVSISSALPDNAPPHLRRVLFNGIISAILFLQHLLSLIACNHIILKDVSCFF